MTNLETAIQLLEEEANSLTKKIDEFQLEIDRINQARDLLLGRVKKSEKQQPKKSEKSTPEKSAPKKSTTINSPKNKAIPF